MISATSGTIDPDLTTQGANDSHAVMLANALACAKGASGDYCTGAENGLEDLINIHHLTGNPNSTQIPGEWDALETCRVLGTYAISAALMDYEDVDFYDWLEGARDAQLQCDGPDYTDDCTGSMVELTDERANNYGARCNFSRIAIDMYLEDGPDLIDAINVFLGRLGESVRIVGLQ